MNIITLIHNNQVFAWTVQLGEFFLFLLLLRWYLVRARQRGQILQTRSTAQGTLEQTVSMLLTTVGCALILFLLLSFFSPVLVLSTLLVIGLGGAGYKLLRRRRPR